MSSIKKKKKRIFRKKSSQFSSHSSIQKKQSFERQIQKKLNEILKLFFSFLKENSLGKTQVNSAIDYIRSAKSSISHADIILIVLYLMGADSPAFSQKIFLAYVEKKASPKAFILLDSIQNGLFGFWRVIYETTDESIAKCVSIGKAEITKPISINHHILYKVTLKKNVLGWIFELNHKHILLQINSISRNLGLWKKWKELDEKNPLYKTIYHLAAVAYQLSGNLKKAGYLLEYFKEEPKKKDTIISKQDTILALKVWSGSDSTDEERYKIGQNLVEMNDFSFRDKEHVLKHLKTIEKLFNSIINFYKYKDKMIATDVKLALHVFSEETQTNDIVTFFNSIKPPVFFECKPTKEFLLSAIGISPKLLTNVTTFVENNKLDSFLPLKFKYDLRRLQLSVKLALVLEVISPMLTHICFLILNSKYETLIERLHFTSPKEFLEIPLSALNWRDRSIYSRINRAFRKNKSSGTVYIKDLPSAERKLLSFSGIGRLSIGLLEEVLSDLYMKKYFEPIKCAFNEFVSAKEAIESHKEAFEGLDELSDIFG